MNDSGRAVAPLVRRFGIEDLARLVVVHDELDLPRRPLQVKAGGGLAGHNGLQSIKAHLHSDDFTRVRIGIGKPPGGREQGVDHVLRAPATIRAHGAGRVRRDGGRRRRVHPRSTASRPPRTASTPPTAPPSSRTAWPTLNG